MNNFLLTCDASFLPHAATVIASLVRNNQEVQIHLIYSQIPMGKLNQLRRSVESNKSQIHFYRIDGRMPSWHVDRNASQANYFRLYAQVLLPETIDKVLYLDCDTLVRGDISNLFEIDMSNSMVAAVWNPIEDIDSDRVSVRSCDYFNSGVMLISLQNWRKEDFLRQLERYIIENSPLYYWDQDALNGVLQGNWLRLPVEYNVQLSFLQAPALRQAYANAVADPIIVHFSGNGLKPWESGFSENPFNQEYFQYRKMTPWPISYPLIISRNINHIKNRTKSILKRVLPKSLVDYLRSIAVKPSQSAPTAGRADHVMKESEYDRLIGEYFGIDRHVKSGPFEGMRYLDRSFGSAYFPKLLGSYEYPIHNVVCDALQSLSLELVVNIGCAEGYYAVGSALRREDISVLAFDTSPQAQEACRELAALNNVSDRISVRGLCAPSDLNSKGGYKTLIICDIEGSETSLLDPQLVPSLLDTKIIVETHDFIRGGTTDVIIERFRRSHDVQIIIDHDTLDRWDALKLGVEFKLATRKDVRCLVDETRPPGMRWLYMVPRSYS